MNSSIYKSFKNELEKTSGVSDAIGKGIAAVLDFAWKHPKITLTTGAAALVVPKIIDAIFKPTILHDALVKRNIMDNQTAIMQGILDQERLSNKKHIPLIPVNKKIERPLV